MSYSQVKNWKKKRAKNLRWKTLVQNQLKKEKKVMMALNRLRRKREKVRARVRNRL